VAQHKWAKAALGTGIDGVAGTSDATSLSGAQCWVILASGVTRDQAAEMLLDVRNKILATSTTFPAA
jgi:hypothetical protein